MLLFVYTHHKEGEGGWVRFNNIKKVNNDVWRVPNIRVSSYIIGLINRVGWDSVWLFVRGVLYVKWLYVYWCVLSVIITLLSSFISWLDGKECSKSYEEGTITGATPLSFFPLPLFPWLENLLGVVETGPPPPLVLGVVRGKMGRGTASSNGSIAVTWDKESSWGGDINRG